MKLTLMEGRKWPNSSFNLFDANFPFDLKVKGFFFGWNWWAKLGREKWSESCSVMSDSLRPHGLYSPWNSPGRNTGVGNHSLLQGIFPTQGLNPGLPHCRQILYQLSILHILYMKIYRWDHLNGLGKWKQQIMIVKNGNLIHPTVNSTDHFLYDLPITFLGGS